MSFRRGDSVLVLYPDSNQRAAKRRPALVIQADQLGTPLSQTIIAMITSNMARDGHPSRVAVLVNTKGGSGTGLLMDSVIMTDNIATIHESEIERVIGRFPGMSEIDEALRVNLAL